jgi:predicted ATPase/signal transduction histidine kinase
MASLSDYVLGETLYAGNETQVRRAVHRASGARVAVKMPVAQTASARVVGDLVHEYAVLMQLSAVPRVVRARELVRDDETAVLVLEDPGFRSLDRILAESERLPLEVGLRLGRQLARALEGVHAAGLMHKDVKPHNVLVDEALEQVLLEDFCLASRLSHEATASSTPEALEGTLAYISPEQTGRTARALDERTDLYSLGVTLFEMLAGRLPFGENDPLALVHAHLAKEPPLLDAIAPHVPKAVAAIVARLLAKDPEQRYQTAKGVAADLDEAFRQWHAQATVLPFALGTKDFSVKLRLPQVLVGREREIAQVGAAFAESASGAAELVLVGGPSGIGKTALVRTVYLDIAKEGRGLLIAGKHDQLAQSTPYAALAQAFGALIRQWLASPQAVLQLWQERIRSEVGDNARLIADVVPELDLLMGKLAPVPDVQGEQVLNRQKLTWLNFARAVATPNAPLVMFLDDMQWADTATLLILETLLTDVERSQLLVIAAYRDNETPPEHPLWKLVEAVDKSGAKVSRMAVGPLSEDQVEAWLSRTLASDAARVQPLARVLWHKTRGNPFFLEQLMLSLHRQKLVLRDPEGGEWRWDIKELEKAAVTDNVVTLLTDKVRQMPEPVQQILGLAACAGHAFHLEDLERLSGWERPRVIAALWPALREELVVPASGAYRPAQALGELGAGVLDAEYQFLHDRVQQASYERIPPEQRIVAHLEIGRRLRERYRSEGGTPQQLLELARHLNLGSPLITSADEPKDLSRLNLAAARAAKAASAHRLMASLLDAAQALLGAALWQEEPELSAEIALERLEAGFLLREFDDVEARALGLLALPLPALARLSVQELRVRSCLATGAYARGQELGLTVLAQRGEPLPQTEEACLTAYLEEATELERWFELTPDALDRMPFSPLPEHVVVDALRAHLILCAGFGGRPMLAALVIVRALSELRGRGTVTLTTPFMIGSLTQASSAVTGAYRRAARWVEPGVRIAERTASPMLGECLVYQGIHTAYFGPADQSAPLYEQAIAAGLKSGSFQTTSWGLLSELFYYRVWRGMPLSQVDAQRKARWGLVQRAGDAVGKHLFELCASLCDLLTDPGGATRLLESEPLSRSSGTLVADQDGLAAELARTVEAHLFLIAGAPRLALSRARDAETFRPLLYGTPPVTDIPLWLALSAAKCWDETTDAEERARLGDHLEHGLARVRYFAEGSPENFLHKLRLLEAEHARVHGRTDEALEKYSEAIELAREQRFLHIEALAAQLAAEFLFEAGRPHVAAFYLREARDAYAHWGALAVVAHLEAKYPTLLGLPVRTAVAGQATQTGRTTIVRTSVSEQLDVQTAARAAEALSSERDPTRVVGRLMELVLENAGAQRGVLLLGTEESLSVVARLSVEGARIETGLSQPLEQRREFCLAVVQYAARTGEPVVLDDAPADVRFGSDRYLRASRVRSVIAVPLVHQGLLGGVLYLEHASPQAFSAARVALLSVLAAQGAVALENASLYAQRRWSQALLDLLPTPVLLLEPGSGTVFFANREADRLAGGEFPKGPARSIIEPPFCCSDASGNPLAEVDLPAMRAARGEIIRDVEVNWHTPAGTHTIASTGAVLPAMFGQPSVVALSLQDITPLKKAEQERENLLVMFVGMLGHDLRSPLATITMATSALDQRTELERQVFVHITRGVDRMSALISDLLDFAQIRLGRGIRIAPKPIALDTLAGKLVDDLQTAHPGRRIEVEAEGDLTGRWDPVRVQQVLQNLVGNALQHGAADHPVRVQLRGRGTQVIIEVHNRGPAIPLALLPQIFEPFSRGAEASTGRGGSIGLGLYIVRQVVTAHGGTIRVTSTEAEGTRFVVELPRAMVEGEPPPGRA